MGVQRVPLGAILGVLGVPWAVQGVPWGVILGVYGVPLGTFGAQFAPRTRGGFYGRLILSDFGAQRVSKRLPK